MAQYYHKGWPVQINDPVTDEEITVECWFYFHEETWCDEPYVDIVEVRYHGNSFTEELTSADWNHLESTLLAECLNNSQ